jgi:hypothetical protein
MEKHPLTEAFLDQARVARANEKAVVYEKAASDMIAYEKAQREKAELIAAVEMYEILLGNYELQPDNHSSKALKDFLRKWPNIASYDSRGNYVGRMTNENGWVP